MMTLIDDILIVSGPDYAGREYNGEYVIREGTDGPGYYLYQYSDAGKWLIRLAARPDVPARRYKYWNGRVKRGWETLREAKAVLSQLQSLRANERTDR